MPLHMVAVAPVYTTVTQCHSLQMFDNVLPPEVDAERLSFSPRTGLAEVGGL